MSKVAGIENPGAISALLRIRIVYEQDVWSLRIQARISRSKMDFRVWRTRAHRRIQHTPGFVFDLQWDSIYVQLRQQFYRQPREQDSFSSHCDCDKERRPILWPETPQNEILKEERPSDTPS
ncbi:hypothetical protein PRIPAC_96710 [Pristionchus pacificus]|uniref:Uncharacterized protein n=1 Tax=Pristionchus pacificus TaxID=54126 RepID=A0A2A6D2F0_PRIPA|nr:hypothetical protein PRIPAC_96710 [Pristionchus pacificus]|eukprot:PDM84569.1 hypothetical protein PRIPAC_33592 [Pristionchus pacificus]